MSADPAAPGGSPGDVPGSASRIDRRSFLRGAAGTAGAVVVLGGAGPALADHDDWEDYTATDAAWDTLVATSVPAYGYDYLMGTDYTDEAVKHVSNYQHRLFGDMRDYTGYTGGLALHQEIEVGAVEMNLADEKVLTSVKNNVSAADNVAYAKGQVAVAEALNAGKTEAEADADMQDVIDTYFAKIQENILNHWQTQYEQVHHHGVQIDSHADLTGAEMDAYFNDDVNDYGDLTTPVGIEFILWDDSANADYTTEEQSVTLLDGRVMSVRVGYITGAWDFRAYYAPSSSDFNIGTSDPNVPGWIRIHDSSGGTAHTTYFDVSRYENAWDDLTLQRDSVKGDLSGYVTDVYGSYEAGELDTADIVDPITLATELGTDGNLRGFREAAAAQLGIPTAEDLNVVIDIHDPDGDIRLWVEMYTDHTPVDGSWAVGETYSPGGWTEPLFVVFEKDTGEADMTQLETDFTIVSAKDDAGTPIDSFDNESTTTHTSDVTAIQEQLDQLRQAQIDLIEMYNNDDGISGGGGGGTGECAGVVGWLDCNMGVGGIPGRAIGLGAAAAAGGYVAFQSLGASAGTTIINRKDD